MATKLSDEAYERKKARNAEYIMSNTMRVAVNLNLNTDYDIIAYLKTIHNKQGLVKELIRKRMEEEQFPVRKEED